MKHCLMSMNEFNMVLLRLSGHVKKINKDDFIKWVIEERVSETISKMGQ